MEKKYRNIGYAEQLLFIFKWLRRNGHGSTHRRNQNDRKLSEMTTNEISKKIRDMYQLRRACHEQVSHYKQIFKDAGNIIDLCEKELMRRGHK